MLRRIKATDRLPKELEHSAPRQVALTAGGIGVAVSMAALAMGAVIAGVLLYQRLSRVEEPVGITQGRVIDVRRGDERLTVNYTYKVYEGEYRGRTRVRKRDGNKFAPDAKIAVQYVLSRPQESWPQGRGPRKPPFWLVVAVPGALLLCIIPLSALMRHQAMLLRDGRGALARVTKTKKRNLGDHSSWRVEYEWRLLSGAIRSGRHDSGKNPPPVGALIPIVYERDNPKRHSPYPLSLVKVAR